MQRYSTPKHITQKLADEIGYALRLASDDLYECRWQVTHHFQTDNFLPSGWYTARIKYVLSLEEQQQLRKFHSDKFASLQVANESFLYDVPFIVRRPPTCAPSAVLQVLRFPSGQTAGTISIFKNPDKRQLLSKFIQIGSTLTWLAYNDYAFAPPMRHPPQWPVHPHIGSSYANTVRAGEQDAYPPSFSMYKNKFSGQPAMLIGLQMPCPSSQPYFRQWHPYYLSASWSKLEPSSVPIQCRFSRLSVSSAQPCSVVIFSMQNLQLLLS